MLEHLILLALVLFIEFCSLLLHGDHEAQGGTTQIIRLRHPCYWGETSQSQLTLLMPRGDVAKYVLTDTLSRIPEEETLRALLLTAQLLESQTHRLSVLRHIIYGARDDVHQILTQVIEVARCDLGLLGLGASLRILTREGGLSCIDLLLRDDSRMTLFTEASRKLASAIDGEENTCIREFDKGSQRLAVKGDQVLLGRVGTPYRIEASRDNLKGMTGLI